MNKRKMLFYSLLVIIVISTSSIVIYWHTLRDMQEGLEKTLKTLDIYSVVTSVRMDTVMLNVSIMLENKAKYKVIVDLIQMNIYVSNLHVGSANPYNQPISFDILPGETCVMFFTCSSNNRNIAEIINRGHYVICGNGTIRGHIYHFFISVSHAQQFSVVRLVS